MEVSTSALRAELATWLRRVAAGDEVVVTERGTPVARLVPVGSTPTIERLIAEGIVSRAPSPRRPSARGAVRAQATAPVSDLVGDQRR
ncbi:type II toxin-antitoxin system Phd/YefM family antitoxin [Quadrisphaera granulorum]|uniref:type II toxin-antitoxin system Phd/YefM family antitoxin n=1 Tax=Quadrisphaera granulorum TaxID=317664 RepID=UPI001B867652|nr:type II toxin-antitoxin system prevent-host-death family antitoxin [Quadrisphaera granulorum]